MISIFKVNNVSRAESEEQAHLDGNDTWSLIAQTVTVMVKFNDLPVFLDLWGKRVSLLLLLSCLVHWLYVVQY